MGIPLLKGRTFNQHDQIGKPWRVMVGKRLADTLWPGEDPVGHQALLWKGQEGAPAEVIGVVANQRERGLDSDPTLTVYFLLMDRERDRFSLPFTPQALLDGFDAGFALDPERT